MVLMLMLLTMLVAIVVLLQVLLQCTVTPLCIVAFSSPSNPHCREGQQTHSR
jgi:hypothetical protein